jgi:diketogulonate reductase-like aldo/keto reductase
MQFETLTNISLPKIGFGTARLGGYLSNGSKDGFFLSALQSAFELGYTHFDTAEFYGFGRSESLIGQALKETGTKRDNVLLTSKVWPTNLSYKGVLRACENSLRRLKTDYIDLYLIHWPNPFVPLKETFRALNQLVHEGKVKQIGVSNFKIKLLQQAQILCETPIIANQIPYSLTKRTYAKNGVLEYCQQNDIIVIAYTPVNHGHLRSNPTLQSIADSHHATPYQIALAWLIVQPRVIAIPMSFNPKHQKENLESVVIQLTQSEMDQLNNLE